MKCLSQGKPAAILLMSILECGYFARYNININNIMHRPEEALDIQSELIFVNGMVHLPHE